MVRGTGLGSFSRFSLTFLNNGPPVDFFPSVGGSQNADVGFAVAVAVGRESGGGGWVLVATAGVAQKAGFRINFVRAAFGSVAIAELGFEPGDQFGVAELRVVFTGGIADFDDGILLQD